MHHINFRVYYEDTDAGGIVYHANYLKFAERARTEMLNQKDLSQHRLKHELGILFVVRRIEIDYMRPAFLDDMVRVKSHIESWSNTSMVFVQEVYRDSDSATEAEEKLCTMRVVIVCIGGTMKPTRIPQIIRTALGAES